MGLSIEESLYRLADTAWSVRRTVASIDFVLRPESLPVSARSDEMELTVERLYRHAGKWAPGFNVPSHVPKVSITPLHRAAGQYGADSDGYVFIHVAPEHLESQASVRTILVHEACHHILDLSGIRGGSREESERLTDLASFICGFGEIVLAGHASVRQGRSGWVRTHLGYLTTEEYRVAQRWVLKSQGLSPQAFARLDGARTDVVAVIWRWLRGLRDGAVPTPSSRAAAIFDTTTTVNRRRKFALTLMGGDGERLERLMEYERQRHPTADVLGLLDAVIESLERDRH